MGWTVILEDEDGEQLDRLSKEFTTSYIDESSNYAFRVLKYLDPYGDTIFNTLQAKDLLTDLKLLKEIEKDNVFIDSIIAIVTKCTISPHTYVVFYGD
jgi:hypothetical protein